MKSIETDSEIITHEQTAKLLRELGIPCHRIGYMQLCTAIPLFAKDVRQSLSKDVYPIIATHWGYSDWRAIEHAIRIVILFSWLHRDPNTWNHYFPNLDKAPSNKLFIATLAEHLKQKAPPGREGQVHPEEAILRA